MSWFNHEKFSDISEANIEDVMKRAEPIDIAGTDAEVFKYGGTAIHEYKDFIDLPLLTTYQELVQRATVFNGRQREVAGHNLTFEVVTLDKIVQAKTGKLYGLSRFVPGGNIFARNQNGKIDRVLHAGIELWLKDMTHDLVKVTGKNTFAVSFSCANTTLNDKSDLLSATDICTHMQLLAGRDLTAYFR